MLGVFPGWGLALPRMRGGIPHTLANEASPSSLSCSQQLSWFSSEDLNADFHRPMSALGISYLVSALGVLPYRNAYSSEEAPTENHVRPNRLIDL